MFLDGSSNIESIYCDFKAIKFGSCHDYYLKNYTESGEYTVYLKARPYSVYCEFSEGKNELKSEPHKLRYICISI